MSADSTLDSTAMERFASEVVTKLRQAGYIAYFAGGCVRDKLLNVEPKDFDVATSAEPNSVREVFGRKRTLAIGQSFGVITVLGPKPHQVEVATFRNDGSYSDGRRPDSVTFSSPEEDAKRRDFTINGMFYDPLKEEVIDFVGGQEDLAAQRIRAIGVPQERINEDRLRMLRAVRFAATYGFQLEQETLEAVRDLHDQISSVSQERITHELKRMLAKQSSRRAALTLLQETKLLDKVLPDVAKVTVEDPERWQRLLNIAERLEAKEASTSFALLFGPDGAELAPKQISEVCRKLKLSNDERKAIEWLAQHYATLKGALNMKFSQLQPLLIADDITPALQIVEATQVVDDEPSDVVAHCRRQLSLPPEKLCPVPFVRGEDLIASGIPAGPKFAQLLQLVWAAQLDGKVLSKEAAISLLLSNAE